MGLVLVLILGIGAGAGAVAFASLKFGEQYFKGVGDVSEEEQAEDDVLIFSGVDIFAQFVGGFPELLFEWLFLVLFFCLDACHRGLDPWCCWFYA